MYQSGLNYRNILSGYLKREMYANGSQSTDYPDRMSFSTAFAEN